MAKKISFPMGDGKVGNGYYNPTSVYQKTLQKRNAKAGIKCDMDSTRAAEPVQSKAFRNGYRNS